MRSAWACVIAGRLEPFLPVNIVTSTPGFLGLTLLHVACQDVAADLRTDARPGARMARRKAIDVIIVLPAAVTK